MAFASTWPLIGTRTSAAESQQSPQPQPALPANSSPPPPLPSERVLGIGGLFFRAKDPKALAEWYRVHLGVSPIPTAHGQQPWHTEAGTTAFAPFPQTTKYFGEPTQAFMVNFRVRNLDAMAAQLRAANIEIKLYPDDPTGRFARIHDPEGNPIELWEPPAKP